VPIRHRALVLLTLAAVVTACSGSTPAPPANPTFRSTVYGYVIAAPEWSGVATSTAWDGTGSPGDGDPFVDTLVGPAPHAFGVGQATTAELDAFTDAFRATDATVHPCPVKPEASSKTTVGGATARIDEAHCPDSSGVFVQIGTVVRAGRAYVFVTYDQPGSEAADRAAFQSLLKGIYFTS
jgi:hypothetical protein